MLKKIPEFNLSIYQMNSSVGSIKENQEKIIKSIKYAEKNDIKLLIFPELALSGYLPLDLFLYSSFMDSIENALNQIVEVTLNTWVILGTPRRDKNLSNKDVLRNSAVIIHKRKIIHEVHKTLMPNYDVFGESRYFQSGKNPSIVNIFGINMGVQVCEDMWDHTSFYQIPVSQIQKNKGAELIINISASPYTKKKPLIRLNIVKNHVKALGIPFIYANSVGGQDSIVFDGRSFIINNKGDLTFSAPSFEEGLFSIKSSALIDNIPSESTSIYFNEPIEKEILNAIVLNLQDYLHKSNFSGKLLVGLSGGIDSAVTVYLASLAVGPENVIGLILPSKYSSEHSKNDAVELAENLNIEYNILSIQEIVDIFSNTFSNISKLQSEWSIADENIQARIRGNILMYFANKLGGMVISTGNKSEIAVGYCTLYGDTVGGKNLIGDLYKHEVYSLARYLNSLKFAIPESSFIKPPSAELKPDQKDTDSLPDYPILDFILEKLIDENMSTKEIVDLGQPKALVEKIAKLVVANEFKRAQIAQTVKISDHAFGRGRIIPIASGFIP